MARRRVLVGALDVVAVLAFVVIGRASHHHGETVTGVVSTLWPFAAGLAAGWALVALTADRPPGAGPRAWVVVTAVTVVVGMGLRVVAGQGTAAPFVVVALVFLGLCFGAGRLAARLALRA